MVLPLRPVGHEHAHAAQRQPQEPPYQWFLLTSLVLAIGGGLAFGIAAASAGAHEWDWGQRQTAVAQAHGQLQLIGFVGIFTAGMMLRLLPRVSGRPSRAARLTWPVLIALALAVILRAIAQPAGTGALARAVLALSAVSFLAGAAGFALMVWTTTLRARPEATEVYFSFGALFLLGAAVLNAAIIAEMIDDSTMIAPVAKQNALVVIEQYGFNLMFICGVATRALPTFSGRPRAERGGRAAAVLLAAGVATFAVAALLIAYDDGSDTRARVAAIGLLAVAVAFVAVVWFTGVLHPKANRIAQASRTQFWFVRLAMVWLLAGAALIAWYGVNALQDGALPDQYAFDAARHTLALGVLTMMILGIGMLIIPEFAARRMHHPGDGPWVWTMLIAANLAVVLRVWPSLEGIDWVESTRYWPMTFAGLLSEGVLLIFAFMFLQSWRERGGWQSPA